MSFSYRRIPKGVIYALAAILILGLAVTLKYLGSKPRSQSANFPVFQKGLVYADWTKEGYITFASDDSLKELAKTRAGWVALTVTWYEDKYNSPQIKPTHRTPSDDSVMHAIKKIHELGMKVMLKPQLDIADTSEGKWRGEIGFNSAADWQAWFNNYRDFIVHYLEIANAENVEIFCLGTELASSTIEHPEEWRKLVGHARDIYKGYLTYAANWHEEFSGIAFWDLLDYAGVDPYFPLTDSKTPSVEELKTAWKPWVKQLDDWQAKIKKPVLFTEIGYKSTEGPADNPWEHTSKGKLDIEAQANCYQALLETFYYKKWLWGVYWWYWQVSINPRLSLTRGFPPRGKPAEEILRKWYSKPDPGIEKAYYLKVAREGLSKNIPVSAPAQESSNNNFILPVAMAMPPAVDRTESSFKPVWQKGMCYVTWNKDSFKNASSDESLGLLKPLGVEWVSLSPTWYQEKFNALTMKANAKTPTDESLVHAINKIHELGMKAMLKPHLDLVDQTEGHWRGEIEFSSDQDWEAWFKSYTDFIVHYAKLAQEQGVEIFCVGTELTRTATTQPNRWREVIKEVKKVYSGRLTYAANWYDEYFRVEFWDLLDYVGVDPYFPLIEKDRPSLAEIRESWKLWEKLLEEWQAKVKKPIIFPEIGYKSSTGTTDQPWVALPGKEVDLQLQRDCYQAVLEAFWDKPWFYGLYWWYWGTHPKMGGGTNRTYTPQNKPAEQLIKEWYHRPLPHEK